MNILTPQFFANNRRKLIESIKGEGLIVVPGNGLLQRSADTTFTFRQDSNFYYLCGINEPSSVLFIDTKNGNSFVIMPTRTGVHAIFDGTQDINKLKQESGIDEIYGEEKGWQKVRSLGERQIYMPQKPHARVGDMYTNPHRAVIYTKIRRISKDLPVDIRSNLANLRSIKSDEELSCIQKAVQITLASINDTLREKPNITTEYQFEAELTKQFRAKGALGHAYSPIIAANKASCTLHYVDNNAQINNKDTLLLDVGAEYNNYAADISRTLVWGDEPSARQTAVISAVQNVQTQLIAFLKPGLLWKELTVEADRLIAQELMGLGLLNKQYEKDDLRCYFPHAVSHYLGLDVHDQGDYTKPLQKNMVITIEPGIYITDEALGVRIEDDVVITENGAKIIS